MDGLMFVAFAGGICIGSFFHEKVEPIYTSNFIKLNDWWKTHVLSKAQ
eukprot:CAMPEP_0171096948 /NCGR_PEP_ID=MMETSP0766_2-20121228/46404_1 /TAXON_ID=439317 /ORGANISM="Gambierdiscus australes, Strain CAWD 149" /LENGTH=47 /DNA_ID= /DNA_START= /DNA_END= /DNA_ORIENTATION=